VATEDGSLGVKFVRSGEVCSEYYFDDGDFDSYSFACNGQYLVSQKHGESANFFNVETGKHCHSVTIDEDSNRS
jgi:hypothetical protein